MKGSPTPPIAPITLTGQRVATAWLQYFNRLTENVVQGNLIGDFADRPAPGDVYPGTLFYADDTGQLYLSTGAAWVDFSTSGGGGVLTIFTTGTAPAPANDEAYLFRDGAVPESLFLKFRIAGTDYQIPLAGPL